jgi:23S rRNA pseudouridine1911/1915/1917 synthase
VDKTIQRAESAKRQYMSPLNNGYQYREEIGGKAVGLNILTYMAGRYPRVSEEEWLDRITSGRVLLNGIPAEPEAILYAGSTLIWVRPPWEEPEVPLSFAILYRDAHMLGVAKPEGLPTLPGGGQFMDNTLLALVRRHFPEANPLHRLGRGTSGVLLFARTPEAHSRVSQAWRRGEVLKVYRTLALGSPAEDGFDINVPIGAIPHPILKTIHAASADGRPSHSRVRVLERREGCSLLEVLITTGRPHQIRIHLAAAGHPLVGDPLYGAGGVPIENSQALPGDLGYHLHSSLLGFSHPVSREWIEISCSPPSILRSS